MELDTDLVLAAALAASSVPLAAVLLATIAQAGQRAASWLARLALSSVVTSKQLNDDMSARVLLTYLMERHGRGTGLVEERYDARIESVLSEDQMVLVWWRQLAHGSRLFWIGRTPVLYRRTVASSDTDGSISVHFLRGTVDWDTLLLRAAAHDDEWRASCHKARYRRFRIQYWRGTSQRRRRGIGGDQDSTALSPTLSSGPPKTESSNVDEPIGRARTDIGRPVPRDPLATLSVAPAMQVVMDRFRFILDRRDWCRERGVPWRFGVGLAGQPGNGKTSLVRAIAQLHDLPVHTFDLSSMDSEDFADAWEHAGRQDDGPRIVLLEDVDAVFRGRDPGPANAGLAFSTLLNAIDGVDRADGVFLFVTTNRLDELDPALGGPDGSGRSGRPGRVDMVAEIGPPDRDGRLKIARRVVRDESLAQELADAGDGDSGAQFTDRCIEAARLLMWDVQP